MGPLLSGVLIWDFVRRLGFGEVCQFFSTIVLQQIFLTKFPDGVPCGGLGTPAHSMSASPLKRPKYCVAAK
jgi:hypothetical protein